MKCDICSKEDMFPKNEMTIGELELTLCIDCETLIMSVVGSIQRAVMIGNEEGIKKAEKIRTAARERRASHERQIIFQEGD